MSKWKIRETIQMFFGGEGYFIFKWNTALIHHNNFLCHSTEAGLYVYAPIRFHQI